MKVIRFFCLLPALWLTTSSVYAQAVNVNKASVEEIAQALSGIGQAKAQAIADHCQKVICKSPQDLLVVKGIGSKTLKKIEADLRFSDE
ncbi:helix-hairpin-helix domain-containing protein [Thiomicrorhabdus sp.]|uniref:ComEA family DNA-binding protein n=1 Tax=Thiomicrorhabdus sp. TaxID=2039724 RepID=UPI0029C8EF08|nr:helix-hairpin-helix domain-containing protein [Thiomicrorhabdus sp.]